jgi:Uma2 family endonuclease
MLPRTKTVTYEEWLNMPEVQDAIEEVVNGEIRIMPPPKWKHAQIVEALHELISDQVDRKAVRVVATQFALIIRRHPFTSRQPDLAAFERNSIVEQDGYIHSAPQLVVEVLSPANTHPERQEKLDDYGSIGVTEAWVVSPEARTVEVLLLEGEQLVRTQLLGSGDILKPKFFPHVQVDIAQIWPD